MVFSLGVKRVDEELTSPILLLINQCIKYAWVMLVLTID